MLEAMRAYAKMGAVAFHTPGHKQGKGIHDVFKGLITEEGLKMEVSLADGLDDLFAPETCIKEAQGLAADLYGADVTHFVVNGTTGAIQAMMMTALDPGDTVLLPRNAHRSVIGAVMLIGAKPIFMEPEIDAQLGIAMGVPLEVLEKALCAHGEAKAVLLVNPTYYGVACDLARAADLIHAHSMLLLVDEAHGPHLRFSADLPPAALDAGADLAAQSTHKILGSLTQTSMLHAKLLRVDENRLRMMNSIVQSTSPNYLLLASLDVARMQMATAGRRLIERAVGIARWAREEINKIEGLYCFGEERLGSGGAFSLDCTKLTVTVKALGIGGAEAGRLLWERYKIQAELSDSYNVLFIVSLGDSEAEINLLLDALRGLAKGRAGRGGKTFAAKPCPPLPETALWPREALFAGKETVLFAESAGKVSGETVTFYPPGIPLLCPGEIITEEIIGYCLEGKKNGLKIVGPEDITLNTIKVVKNICGES